NAFHELKKLTSPEDVLIIYYSGSGGGDFWITADTKLNDAGEEQLNIIDSKELYSLIDAIPALNKYLIIDSQFGEAFEGFIERVQQTKLCSLFLSASIGQDVREVNIEDIQKIHGYFTYALVQELQRASQKISIRDLFERVKESVQSKFTDQTPFFLGGIDKPLFFAYLPCLDFFTFSQRRCYSAFDDCSLETLHQRAIKIFTSIFPDFYYSLGLAFLKKGNNAQALVSLKTAIENVKQNVEEKLVDLGVAQFNNQLYAEALQTFQKCSKMSTSVTANDLLSNIIAAIDSLTKSKRCALLVGIDTYLNANRLVNGTSVDDTLALQNILTEKCGFQSEDIRILLNEEATHENILTAFQELIAESQANSTLFYFAGRGSNDKQDNPTILAFDSRSQGIQDIQLAELASLTTHKEINLLSIIDSNWTYTGDNNRYTSQDETIYPSIRKLIPIVNAKDRDGSKIPRIGYASIYPGLIRYQQKNHDNRDGRLTSELIQFLRTNSLVIATHQKLLHFFRSLHQETESEDENVCFSSSSEDILQQILFSNHVFESKVRVSLTKMEQEPTRHAVLILQRLIEQRNGSAPEELFNLGIAHYKLKEYDKSISALQTAIDRGSGQNNATTEGQTTSQGSYPKAHYWLGRVLYESKKDPARAVSELRLAIQESPDNIAAHYYLGKALRTLVEQEILMEAEQAFQTYLNAGSPLGQQQEVQEFLKSRKISN
ncbi:MAG: caspase family protein, partial [Waterburya sp.]